MIVFGQSDQQVYAAALAARTFRGMVPCGFHRAKDRFLRARRVVMNVQLPVPSVGADGLDALQLPDRIFQRQLTSGAGHPLDIK